MIRISRMWRIYMVYTVILLAGMTLAGFILKDHLTDRLNDHLEEQLLMLARVIAKVVPETEDPAVLDPFCRDYRKAAGVRITLIKKNGSVVGESNRESIGINSHLKRPEVQGAIRNGVGRAIRYSRTLDADMTYVALRLKERQKIIRLAMPLTKVKTIENEVMKFLAIALYLIPVVAMVICFFFAGYMSAERYGFS